ncbi:hypothetical protein KEJ27_08285 [Candidatus Bathyarchaeota archaeon]|nr:hypothetical protein [Candidatus Bathyarchaeota archaeon]MBS7617345.1 hypothetical protein [Candidatus Bathyarchaeota archaeon]
MVEYSDKYLALMGGRLGKPKRIPHWEHWSCPDAETYITGIDFYEHPRLCRLKMAELYPQLELPIPERDDPIPRPENLMSGRSSYIDEHGRRHVRWSHSLSDHWNWGERFKTLDDVFSFSPLKQGDFTNIPVVESRDYRDEGKLYREYRALYPAEWGDKAPEGSTASVSFYNTMFMWPLLTFGWKLFLRACLDERFEKIMDEFAEINRRVFRIFARLPVNFVICHDDIVTSRGPTLSPAWMRKYIFPRYREFWEIVRDAGKVVIFMSDGCLDVFVDDIIACGAQGIITEPYTDIRAIARKYPNIFLAGEGDCRILLRNNPVEIEAMVHRMVETARIAGGYAFCIGNHIPWNTPPQAVKLYLDLCTELRRLE